MNKTKRLFPKGKRPRKPPETGWHLIKIFDAEYEDPLGAFQYSCDRCNHGLRYVHVLEHDEWPTTLFAGCCCARRLSDSYDPYEAETEVRGISEQRQRFIDSPRWKESANGNPSMRRAKRLVTVFPSKEDPECFNACIRNARTKETIFVNCQADTIEDAKAELFKAMKHRNLL